MSVDPERALTLDAAGFERVREFAEARGMDLADALALVVHRGVEDQERRDAGTERLDGLERSVRTLHHLIDAGLGPRVFAVARLLAGRESLVSEEGIAEEDFLAATLVMGRHEWEGFTADLEAASRRSGGPA